MTLLTNAASPPLRTRLINHASPTDQQANVSPKGTLQSPTTPERGEPSGSPLPPSGQQTPPGADQRLFNKPADHTTFPTRRRDCHSPAGHPRPDHANHPNHKIAARKGTNIRSSPTNTTLNKERDLLINHTPNHQKATGQYNKISQEGRQQTGKLPTARQRRRLWVYATPDARKATTPRP